MILKALLLLTDNSDPSCYNESSSLVRAICNVDFVFGLLILRLILSSTDALSRYSQGKDKDVITAKRTAAAVVLTIRGCRTEESFELFWESVGRIVSQIKEGINVTTKKTIKRSSQRTITVLQRTTKVLTHLWLKYSPALQKMTSKFYVLWQTWYFQITQKLKATSKYRCIIKSTKSALKIIRWFLITRSKALLNLMVIMQQCLSRRCFKKVCIKYCHSCMKQHHC